MVKNLSHAAVSLGHKPISMNAILDTFLFGPVWRGDGGLLASSLKNCLTFKI
jgi:hypothetical protein